MNGAWQEQFAQTSAAAMTARSSPLCGAPAGLHVDPSRQENHSSWAWSSVSGPMECPGGILKLEICSSSIPIRAFGTLVVTSYSFLRAERPLARRFVQFGFQWIDCSDAAIR